MSISEQQCRLLAAIRDLRVLGLIDQREREHLDDAVLRLGKEVRVP